MTAYLVSSGTLSLFMGVIWSKKGWINVALKTLFFCQTAVAIFLLAR